MLAELRESDATGEIAGDLRPDPAPLGRPLRLLAPAPPGHAPRLARVDVGRAGARLHERRRAGRGLARRRRPRRPAAGAALARRARGVGRGRSRRGGDPRDLRQLRPREPGQPRAVGPAAPAPHRRAPVGRRQRPARLDAAGAAWVRCPPSPIPPRCRPPSARCWPRSAPPWPARSSSRGSTGCSRRGRPFSPTWRRCCGRIWTTRRRARRASGSWPRWMPRSRACSPPCRRCPPRPAMPPAAEFARGAGRARHVSQDQSRDGRLRPHARRRAAPPLTRDERTIP